MNDNDLMTLFDQGSTPERDELFAARVANDIRRLSFLSRLKTWIRLSIIASLIISLLILLVLSNPIAAPLAASIFNLLNQPLIQGLVVATCLLISYTRRPIYK